MLKPKVGDMVRLKSAIVSGVYDGHFTIARGNHAFGLYCDMIEEILPRPLAVGDRVVRITNGSAYRPGRVVAIHEDRAWVHWEAGHGIEKIAELVRSVDPS